MASSRFSSIARLTFPTLLAVGTLGIGCNLLLDVDGYAKDDAGVDAGPRPDAGSDASRPDAAEDATSPPPGALAGSWARWIMPNGVEAGVSPSIYEVIDANQVVERKSDRTWWRTATLASSFEKATEACKKLGSYRLPTRIELVSLLEFGPRQEPTYFAKALGLDGAAALRYWTRSYVLPAGPDGYLFWMVDFGTGATVQEKPSGAGYGVVCVKDAT